MATTACIKMVTVLEHYRVSPPLDPSITVKILPLTFFDIVWLKWKPNYHVYFYDFPCSTTELMQTLVPHLKKSLALALKYYFPLCGNLITPTNLANGTTPAIHYSNNDSVSLTIAEFTGSVSQGFKHLSGSHARDVDELLALVPQLERSDTNIVEEDSIMISPVFSTQVTLFPNQGFSIGFTKSHVVSDGKALSYFTRTWASINAKQLNGEYDCDNLETLPFYDRSVIEDPKGIVEEDSIMISPVFSTQVTLFPNQGFSIGFTKSHVVSDGKALSYFTRTWASINAKQLNGEYDCDNLETLPFYDRSVIEDPKGIASIFLRAQYEISKAFVPAAPTKHMVQATLVMNLAQIQGLKNLVLEQIIPHVSTFIVTCAYVWTCMAKAHATLRKERNDENEVQEHFCVSLDIRTRLDPPISSNYFGNAIAFCFNTLKTCQLVGDEGFINAVEEIRKNLHEKINHEEGVLQGLEMFFDDMEAINKKGQRTIAVAGSPKFDHYGTDFGWGKPKKYELVSATFALYGFRNPKEDFEIGICLPKDEMDAFTTIFYQGLIS